MGAALPYGEIFMARDFAEFTDRLVKAGFSYEQASVLQKLQEEMFSNLQSSELLQTPTGVASSKLVASNEKNVLVEKRQIVELSNQIDNLTRELKDQAFTRKLNQSCVVILFISILMFLIASR